MPVQYYVPRNELTYRYRYTRNNVCFKHYVTEAPSFVICCIAAMIDEQPLSWECRAVYDFLKILVDGVSGKGFGITAFFKEEILCGTLPVLVEIIHYAHLLFQPSLQDINSIIVHLNLFEKSSSIQYVAFLKQRWKTSLLQQLDSTSLLFKGIK